MKIRSYQAFTFIVLLVSICWLTACKSTQTDLQVENSELDYVIFGSYYGYCMGEDCIRLFKVEDNKLYRDTLDLYPTNQESAYPQQGFVLMGRDAYELVSDFYESLPEELLELESQTFGMPDAYDQGGAYIEVFQQGELKKFYIDQNAPEEPEYLQELVEEINRLVKDM